jgi:glycosyltransferase involved in cell wall biosynthesis
LAGSVLIEAALAELPIIAYDFEWHSEVIIDRYSGLLVNFRNIPALREATDFLLDHTMEVKHYGRRAREIAYSLLLPDHIVEKEKIIYSCLLD